MCAPARRQAVLASSLPAGVERFGPTVHPERLLLETATSCGASVLYTATSCGATVLYTEDRHLLAVIADLEIVDPFAGLDEQAAD